MKINPLAALFAIVIVGITIEAVERQSKQAAYALLVLILLGIVTFNARAFSQQMTNILALVNQASKPTVRSGGRTRRPADNAGVGR